MVGDRKMPCFNIGKAALIKLQNYCIRESNNIAVTMLIDKYDTGYSSALLQVYFVAL